MLCLWKEQTDSAVWHGYSAVMCDIDYIGICCIVCYSKQCCVYRRNRQTVLCGKIKVLYCVTLYILVFGVECVTVNNVVFMEGTDRQCSVVWL